MLWPAHTLDPLLILILALAVDAVVGDPAWLWRAVPHPAAALGRLVDALDRGLNRAAWPQAVRRLAGVGAVALLVAFAAALGWAVSAGLRALPWGWAVEAVLLSTLLAQNSLYVHVHAAAQALERAGLAGGRAAVRHIVGRDPESLDEAGVSRAALESLAESFSDGVVAPAFWAALFGLPGALAYKAINTADSMIGHRTERHRAFGWAAARLDDGLNLVPARLAGLLIAGAAVLMPGADARRAFAAMWRDARHHRSPNAGWQEAPLAGALGVALAGPRRYGGVLVPDHWMNEGGRTEATAADVRRGLRLYLIACALLWALAAVVLALVRGL
ncbi:MAG: cobalamin biosynthesis protein CobD [Rhodospirillaceae bacterium]|nr:cobalamin biosynthesis protein CobD [Rhodospirillaceae bacterium]